MIPLNISYNYITNTVKEAYHEINRVKKKHPKYDMLETNIELIDEDEENQYYGVSIHLGLREEIQ